MINLFFFKTFIAVAQTGSFRLAAEKNHITQPAVSQHIRLLERTLNCVLFERTSRKILLTPAGQIFLTYALQIMDLYEKAKTKIAENDDRYSGIIHIASIYTMGLYLLKPTLQLLLKKHPNINIQLEYVQHDTIYEIIKNGTADFGLVAYPKTSPGCDFKVFTEESLVLVQSHDHVLFKKKAITLKDLMDVKFVGLSSKTPTGQAILDALASKGIRLKILKEDNNIEIVKSAVDVGMGFSILPRSTVVQELKNKTFDIINVKDFKIKRPLAILHSKKKVFSKASRLFYEMINKIHFTDT